MSIRAAYKGFCPDCGSPVHPGDEIEMTADLDWVHVECPDELAVSSGATACPRCFLIHAGECF